MSTLPASIAALFDEGGCSPAASWLLDAAKTIGSGASGDKDAALRALRIAVARAPRKVGREALELGPERYAAHGLPQALAGPHWRAFDLARVALVVAHLETLPQSAHVTVVAHLLQSGELAEQESLLRGLSLLPAPERFLDLAIDACRTNAVPVFASLTQHNPYPAAHFPEAAFNQMVLKALFIGLPMAGIQGLKGRLGPELGRMARSYASERAAAQRPLSDDLRHVIALCQSAP